MTPVAILMAEDDKEDQLLANLALKRSKLTNPFLCVDNGQKCIDYLNRLSPYDDLEKYPDPGLIILDLNMPVKDGMSTLKEIKSSDKFNHIPVIILTTSNEEEEVIKGYNEGADSFITKPLSLNKLITIMEELGNYWFSIVEQHHE
ncbi:MAG: response regulator [Gammaproteobacteria bacterium]|nr:response regulator [Gammaproteobacteria bacterium]